jgi:ABC-2 type transport system permease protein
MAFYRVFQTPCDPTPILGMALMKNFLHNILIDLRAIFLDRGVMLVMVLAVILYAFVYPLPYAREVLRKVPLVVIDQDNSALSRQLVRMIDSSELVGVYGRAQSLEEAHRRIASGRYGAALFIPADFEKMILKSSKANVAAYADATYFLVYRQAMTGIVEAARTLSAGIQIRRFQAKGWSAQKADVDRSPLTFIDRPLFNPSMGYATYIVPGVLIFILQQTMLIGIGMISGTRADPSVKEKDIPRGAAGLRLLSRTTACLPLYFIHILFIYGVAYRVWDFPMHAHLASVFLYLLPFLLSVILLGQTLANFFKTRETAIVMLVWSSLIAVLASGYAWPMEAMPPWIKALSMLLPSTWGVSGMLRLTQMGASLQQVGTEWAWLWGLTGLYLILAWLPLRFGSAAGRV